MTDTFHEPWHYPGAKVQHDQNNADSVGEIFLRCNAKEVVDRCSAVARNLILSTYGASAKVPDIKILGHVDATFPYILSHLEYIIGELLRNSIQAVTEHCNGKNEPCAPIEVLICETAQHVIFRISDQGGGIPPEMLPHLWSFGKGPGRDMRLKNLHQVPQMAATMQEVAPSDNQRRSEPKAIFGVSRTSSLSSLTSRAPDLRLGIGLPMSKIYAEYWAGSLEIHSLEGYGVDAFLQISKLGNKNEQLTTRASMDAV